jgi:hypothetical protein
MTNSPSTATPAPSPFLVVMAISHRFVLPIRAISCCCEIMHQLFGAKVSPRLIMLLWSALAPAVAVVLVLFNVNVWNITLLPVGAYSLLLFLLFYYPETSWAELQRIGPDIDKLMPNEAGKQQLAEWLAGRPTLRQQAVLTLIGTAVGLLLATALVRGHKLIALDCAPFLIETTVVGGLGLNSVSWLWQAPSLARLLVRAPDIHLDWPAPAETPGIALSRLLIIRSAGRVLVGAFVTLAPIIIIELVEGDSTVALSAISGVSLITFTTVIFGLVLPRHWLTLIVSSFETNLFAKFRASLADENPVHPRPATYEQLAIFHLLISKRTIPVDIKFVISLIVASLGALVSLAAFIVSVA